MSEIKLFIDGNEVQLTSEQIEELSNKYSSCVVSPLFRRVHNEPYFTIAADGYVEKKNDFNYDEDDALHTVANYCTDKYIMLDRAKNEVLNRLLWQFSMENGWCGDPWEATGADKYCLQYNHFSDDWQVRKLRTVETLGTVYFVSEEVAKRALNEIVIPFENGELEVCEIWDE